MSTFTLDMPEQDELSGGGNYLDVEGRHLLQVTHTDDQPTNREGQAIDAFKADFSVAAGPQAGKKTDLLFYAPKSSSKDGGKWARAKRGAFAIATGLTDESKCGQQVSVDLSDAVNRLVVVDLEFGQETAKGKRFLELKFANIFHVDDPRVAEFLKPHQKVIDLLPKDQRRDPASFKIAGSAAGNGSGQATAQSQPAADDDLSDL